MTDTAGFRAEAGGLVGEGGGLRVVFDGVTGGIRTLENRLTGHVFAEVEAPRPWRLLAQGSGGPFFSGGPPSARTLDPEPAGFEFSVEEGSKAARLVWRTSDPGVRVEVEARLVDDRLELWPRVRVAEDVIPPEHLEYPLFEPRPLATAELNDRLLYPAQAGWVFRSPLSRPPLATFYPDGYTGSALQFMAYYEQGRGGFYLACHDPHATCKRLCFGADKASFQHLAWDLRRGSSLDLDYPVVIAPLVVGDWYEPAARYRAWALPNAPWCEGGVPVAQREERRGAAWLREEVGLSIWCAPSSLDWSRWYRLYAELAETPLHVVPGWDWPQTLPPSLGRDGVFPARFHEANVRAWEGHYVTPYLNDLFISSRAPDFPAQWEPNLIFPYAGFPWIPFSEPSVGWVDGGVETPTPETTTNLDFFACPATDAFRELHAWRDEVLARDYSLDGVFYDISSGNPENWSRCLRAEHGHTPGRGREIVRAYSDLNRVSKETVRRSTGRYFVQGVEVINETLLDTIDFYVSRACAGPLGLLETWMLGPEDEPGGERELVPLFQAVYHDVGPVHEDGWITLDPEEGTLFFWIAARIYLQWGGVLSLQYSTVPPESLDGHPGPAETVLWHGAVHRWERLPPPDPGKVDFVKELAWLRTTVGRPYVGYGELLRSLPLELGTVELDFRQRIYGHGAEGILNEGIWRVPEVIHAAWRDQAGRVALFFVNIRGDEDVHVRIDADAAELWGAALAGAPGTLHSRSGSAECGAVDAAGNLSLDLSLPPRKIIMLELGDGKPE